ATLPLHRQAPPSHSPPARAMPPPPTRRSLPTLAAIPEECSIRDLALADASCRSLAWILALAEIAPRLPAHCLLLSIAEARAAKPRGHPASPAVVPWVRRREG